MKELLKAINDRFIGNTSDAFYTGLSGRFYLYEAPQNSAYPYAVISLISEVPEDFFDGTMVEATTLQVDIYDKDRSPNDLMNLETYCNSFFNGCALTITGYSHLKMVRELSMLMRDPEDNVWRVMQQYEVVASQ